MITLHTTMASGKVVLSIISVPDKAQATMHFLEKKLSKKCLQEKE